MSSQLQGQMKKKKEMLGSFKYKWVLSQLWAPMVIKLQGFKTPFCGSRMESTKKRKMIVEKFSFQKVYFPHDFQISKFMHRLGVKRQICPFSRKTQFLWFEYRRSKHKSRWGQHNESKKVEINIFRNQESNPLMNMCHMSHPGPSQTRLNTIKIFQSY